MFLRGFYALCTTDETLSFMSVGLNNFFYDFAGTAFFLSFSLTFFILFYSFWAPSFWNLISWKKIYKFNALLNFQMMKSSWETEWRVANATLTHATMTEVFNFMSRLRFSDSSNFIFTSLRRNWYRHKKISERGAANYWCQNLMFL